jgi:hypothetical protein
LLYLGFNWQGRKVVCCHHAGLVAFQKRGYAEIKEGLRGVEMEMEVEVGSGDVESWFGKRLGELKA